MKELIPLPTIQFSKIEKPILVLSFIVSAIYLSWWFIPSHIGNPYLYALLFFGEIYHVFMAYTFWMTMWPRKRPIPVLTRVTKKAAPTVDIFITVAGEPVEIVRETAIAARDLDYASHTVYLLNDSFVAKKDSWEVYETLGRELGINCITRKIPGGAKAGNINNALKQTSGKIVVIFDADMIPHRDFLTRMIPYFTDKKVGFVQSPQYYSNHTENEITAGSWEQQELFFGPIMIGKDSYNSAFICGTNVAIRREALLEVGGMCEDNIAEDFLTSLSIHQKGWKSHYISDVLATGLAPQDLLSYYKQQLRWARGSLEVLFGSNPLLKPNLSWYQKIQYLSSALYYFNGVVVFIDMMMPIAFLLTGIQPVAASTTSFALFFIPFMCLNLYTLYIISGRAVTFRAMSFSQASWTLQLKALWSVLLKQKMGFAVTPKQAQTGNFLFLVYPHLTYIALVILSSGFAIYREGINPSIMANVAWTVFNISMFIPFIIASYDWEKLKQKKVIPALT